MFYNTFNITNISVKEKEKMLVASIFSLSHNVFYPMKEKSHFLAKIELSFADPLNLDQSKIFLFNPFPYTPF